MVADNFHYGDEDEIDERATFESLQDAIESAKTIVDKYLHSALKPGMTAKELYDDYTSFGDDPFIRSPDRKGVLFSAWTYAKARCEELCPPDTDRNHI